MRRVLGALAVTFMTTGSAFSDAQLLDWSDLQGWARDDHDLAVQVFQNTCMDMKDGDWPAICEYAKTQTDARAFFETFFRPVMIVDDEPPLFTGYYEPELPGSRNRTSRFNVPLHQLPDDVPEGPWLTRAELEETGVLQDRGLEIAWLEDPVDKFFLQVQGSGRIALQDGDRLRVGYGGKNGHEYRSVGKELIRRGIFEPHQVSAAVIRNWVQENPEEGRKLLHHNPSYVFFREVTRLSPDEGPLGAMNRALTAGRSLAVDPDVVPLGAPVWLEKDGAEPIRRLMIAQDTGSAVKGAQRADVFYGSGDKAGDIAGRIRDNGRMVVLLPIADALALVDRG
ncbi:MltA domain-containing protein [Rhodobacteraceae bacterium]|nr:MltA domain-containing protein [Paracoccaceae bacterium]